METLNKHINEERRVISVLRTVAGVTMIISLLVIAMDIAGRL